ncbi:hypothetical protein [Maribellus sediminis]|uniref:hypothetical protein n=1 Tax=Maribellus sediminis TaxID=2696285 RepID=UPI00143170B4|nr:hypothetical protein [Maribellus sediminis]
MDKLEHNIKKAFEENDAGFRYHGKEAMWKQLDNSLGTSKKVAAWWRVAAVFLGLLLAGGVFAGINYQRQHAAEIAELDNYNSQLQFELDSLKSIPTQVKTETKTVEKVVYRDRFVQQKQGSNETDWEQKYVQLQDSTEHMLFEQQKTYKEELAKLTADLQTAQTELTALKNADNPEQTEPFQLKSERVELGVQKKPTVNNPELEVKIFPKNFGGKTNDLNRTLFKK